MAIYDSKIEVFADFRGGGILPYFIPYIYPIGPVWGLTLGSYIYIYT